MGAQLLHVYTAMAGSITPCLHLREQAEMRGLYPS